MRIQANKRIRVEALNEDVLTGWNKEVYDGLRQFTDIFELEDAREDKLLVVHLKGDHLDAEDFGHVANVLREHSAEVEFSGKSWIIRHKS